MGNRGDAMISQAFVNGVEKELRQSVPGGNHYASYRGKYLVKIVAGTGFILALAMVIDKAKQFFGTGNNNDPVVDRGRFRGPRRGM